MIQVRGLIKVFPSGNRALAGLEMSVASGEIMALLGPNGAGKTTAIRILTTLSGFDAGEVRVAGFDVDQEPEKVRQSIGLVAQNTGIDYFLTGRENLLLQGQMYRMKAADIRARIDELAQYFSLTEALDRQVMGYSGGMRRKLDIATALIHRPKVLFLDEPTLGLDIKSRKSLWSYIRKLNEETGLTILLTTHYLEEADKLSHRVSIINAGSIRRVGTPEELKNSIHGDALTLTFERQDKAVDAFAAAVKQQGLITGSVWEGNKLHLYVDQGAAAVPGIMTLAGEHGAAVTSLSLSRPSLDDVFIKYTGTSMEGPEEEEGEPWWKQWAGKGGGGDWQKWAKKWQQEGGEGDGSDDGPGAGQGGQGGEEGRKDWQQWQKPGSGPKN